MNGKRAINSLSVVTRSKKLHVWKHRSNLIKNASTKTRFQTLFPTGNTSTMNVHGFTTPSSLMAQSRVPQSGVISSAHQSTQH